MQAQLKSDNTRRTIVLNVMQVPDIDVTRSWHKKPRHFRPDRVEIILSDDRPYSVNVSGFLVLKSGGTSDSVRENQRWYSPSTLDRMPAWLQLLVREAPAGVTLWNEPEAQTL